jgi:hypothetical protein
MKRRTVLRILASGACGLAAGPRGLAARGARAEVRIVRSLDEAVPVPGTPILLVFFATGCPSCYDDLFEARLLVERGGWPVTVTGVYAGPEEELRSFLVKYGWTRPAVLDRRKILFRKHRVEAVPFKVLLLEGRTAYRDDPRRAYNERMEALRKCLEKTFSR